MCKPTPRVTTAIKDRSPRLSESAAAAANPTPKRYGRSRPPHTPAPHKPPTTSPLILPLPLPFSFPTKCEYWTFCADSSCPITKCGGTKGQQGGCCHTEIDGTIPKTPCKGRTSGKSSTWQPPPPPPPIPTPIPPPHGAPNVLFIAVDDLRPQLGVYGHNETLTPNFDKFAKSSLVFTNAHAQIAHCSPSRNSLMSGRTPDHVEVWNFIDDFRSQTVGGGATISLPEYFRIHGYFTTGAGKVFHPNKPKANDQNYSWSEPYGSTGGGLCHNFKPAHHPSWFACDANLTSTTDPRVADNAVANWALRKLAELANANRTAAHGKPFFVAAGIHKPHLPYFFPPEFGQMYPSLAETPIPPEASLHIPTGMPPVAWMACMGKYGEEPNFADFDNYAITQNATVPTELVRNITRGYMASVSYVDSQIGLILDALEEHSLVDHTIVAIWGDHGQSAFKAPACLPVAPAARALRAYFSLFLSHSFAISLVLQTSASTTHIAR